ncbi:hypothetical protein JAAARDRAFT_189213 [Jaapia argillacea MUCL 33604]|uniref:Uncharacterized protein n=1 Tax=Jaapia argillacea MUCL 33604 TaxID=933084 RepID=A0A067Q9D2_9AGAM|nr:hypothetical protein JAAARDRAFT_189213 [Jaapia argillacea MUCL 33604]
MPTSTVPFEVLFEFVNDSRQSATLHILRSENDLETSMDAMVLLYGGENISLVLTAGSAYNYMVKQHGKEARLTLKVWQDTTCKMSDIYPDNPPRPANGACSVTPFRGLTITRVT